MAKDCAKKNSFYLLKCGLVAISLAGASLMGGCGDDGGSSGGAAKLEAKISGSVSNKNGMVSEGKLEVKDSKGTVVATTHFTGGQYKVAVPAGTSYPIQLIAHPPADSVLNEPVKAVVTSAIADRMDITAVTTDVVDGAMALGGLTEQNITKASGVAINMRQKEGVSAGAGGGGMGAGQSGGGAGQGGHAGHNMEAMRKAQEAANPEKK